MSSRSSTGNWCQEIVVTGNWCHTGNWCQFIFPARRKLVSEEIREEIGVSSFFQLVQQKLHGNWCQFTRKLVSHGNWCQFIFPTRPTEIGVSSFFQLVHIEEHGATVVAPFEGVIAETVRVGLGCLGMPSSYRRLSRFSRKMN